MRMMLTKSNGSLVLTALLLITSFFAAQSTPAASPQHKLKVALYVDKGASKKAKHNFRELLGACDDLEFRGVDGDEIYNGVLKNYDVLLVPGGSAMKDAFSMGKEARDNVRSFVKEGGIYMGVCAGAYLSSRAKESYLDLIPLKTRDQEHWFRTADGAPIDVELTAEGKEVFGLNKNHVTIIYENGPIFAMPQEPSERAIIPLGYFRSEVVAKGGKRGVMLGAPAMVLAHYGKGQVLAISPHPEKTDNLHQIIIHALFWLRDHRE